MKKFKRIKALLLSLSVAVSAAFCGFAMTACNDGNSGNGNSNNGDSNNSTDNEIITPEKPLALTTSVETNENGENTYTINAIVNPSTLTPRWAIVWEDSASEWAQDKDTADYFNLELSNADKTAKLSTKQAFGETALLTATISSPTGAVCVSKKVEYSLVTSYELGSTGKYYWVAKARDADLYTIGILSDYNNLPVKKIRANVFEGFLRLKSLEVPSSIIDVGSEAFKNCAFLERVSFLGRQVSFGYAAFKDCSCLKSITVVGGVTDLSTDIFSGCLSLESIQLSSYIVYAGVIFRTIDSGAFAHCRYLTSITIPDGVSRIEGSAFFECIRLNSVTIPASVKQIQSGAFSNCLSLKEVIFLGDKSEIEIAADAFEGCPYQP